MAEEIHGAVVKKDDDGEFTVDLAATESHDGHFYVAAHVPTGKVSWIQAAYLANALGGYLASPNDQAENDFIFVLVDDGVETVSTVVRPASLTRPSMCSMSFGVMSTA